MFFKFSIHNGFRKGCMGNRRFFSFFLHVALFFFACKFASAKIIEINLYEFIGNSEFIAEGVVSSSTKENQVLVNELIIVKGGRHKTVAVCRDDGEPHSFGLETIDLSRLVGRRIIIFANRSADCYEPVLSYRSIIQIEGKNAYTEAISDQPLTQPVDLFMQKIRFVTHRNKK